LAYPVAEVAKSMLPPDFIQAGAAEKLAGGLAKNAVLIRRASGLLVAASFLGNEIFLKETLTHPANRWAKLTADMAEPIVA
jgi:hypothetical protein